MYKLSRRNAMGEIVTLEQAAERLNLGIASIRKHAKDAGAALKIGRSYRVNINKLIDYLCNMTMDEEKANEK